MSHTVLEIPPAVHEALWGHLLPMQSRLEEAAFVFARRHTDDGNDAFRYMEWFPVPPNGFASRSAFHLELSGETRATVIKRAYDLGASLVEFHSHIGAWPARFSPSDWAGFEEFVPHVWWRLKGRPYAAVVVAANGFDGLVWLTGPQLPERLDGILVDGKRLQPTRLSPLKGDAYDESTL